MNFLGQIFEGLKKVFRQITEKCLKSYTKCRTNLGSNFARLTKKAIPKLDEV